MNSSETTADTLRSNVRIQEDVPFVRSEQDNIRSLINWMETKARKKGPLAQIYHAVIATGQEGEKKASREIMIARVGMVCSSETASFIHTVIADGLTDQDKNPAVDNRLGYACAATICVARELQEVTEYLRKWQQLKTLIGLDDDPRVTFFNYPRYHVGSWRCMYFATMLNFFECCRRENIGRHDPLTSEELKTRYIETIAWPVAALFKQFFDLYKGRGEEDDLWKKVEQKIGFLASKQKAHWRTLLLELDPSDKNLPRVWSNYCLPFFMRELMVRECEQSGLDPDRARWLYASRNTMHILNYLIRRTKEQYQVIVEN